MPRHFLAVKRFARIVVAWTCLAQMANSVAAAEGESAAGQGGLSGAEPMTFSPLRIDSVNRRVTVLGSQAKRAVPRFFAAIRTATVLNHPEIDVEVHPEVDHWIVAVPESHAADAAIIEFESAPISDAADVVSHPAADGTIRLRACLGHVSGAKLRFEPQPHKNTIGYWVDADAEVRWDFLIERSGEYNLAVLYGCGEGQGGVAEMTFHQDDATVRHLVDAEPTGHFQNFRWHPSGVITLPSAGRWTLTVAAETIRHQALMDIREIHLSIKRP